MLLLFFLIPSDGIISKEFENWANCVFYSGRLTIFLRVFYVFFLNIDFIHVGRTRTKDATQKL